MDKPNQSIRKIDHYEHHDRQELCETRKKYRQGKKKTAVKVYTIADESCYLLIHNVPKLSGVNVAKDLKILCRKYGNLLKFELIDYGGGKRTESFNNIYLVQYEKLIQSINAKKAMDDHEFYGSFLHVCYAPENETLEDIQSKLESHKRYVKIKLVQYDNLMNNNRNKRGKF